MTDIVTLGLAVDTTEVTSGATALDQLDAAGRRVDATQERIADSGKRAYSGQANMQAATISSTSALSAASDRYFASLQRQVDAMQRENDLFGASQAAVARYDAAKLGLNVREQQLAESIGVTIGRLRDQQVALASAAAAESAAAAAGDAFIASLVAQSATLGMSTSQLLAYRAAQLGVSAEAAPLIGRIEAFSAAQAASTQATTRNTEGVAALGRAAIYLAAAFGAFKMADYIKDAALLNSRYETLGVVMKVVGENAQYTSEQMNKAAEGMQATGISMIQSRTQAIRLVQAHIDLADATKLARIAQDAAVIGNINSSDAFDRMIHGIQTGHPLILRTLGINVDFHKSYEILAEQLGKTTGELTENEKMTARVGVVMAKGSDIAGTYEAAMGTAGKQILSMQRYHEDLKVKIGEVFNEALTFAVTEYTAHLKDTNKELDRMANSGELQSWGQTVTNIFVSVLDAINNAIIGVKLFASLTAASVINFQAIGEYVKNTFGSFSPTKVMAEFGKLKSSLDSNKKQWEESQDELLKGVDKFHIALNKKREDEAAKLQKDLFATAFSGGQQDNHQYTDQAGKGTKEKTVKDDPRAAILAEQLALLKQYADQEKAIYADQLKVVEEFHRQGSVSDSAAYAAKVATSDLILSSTIASYDKEITVLAAFDNQTVKEQEQTQKKINDVWAKRVEAIRAALVAENLLKLKYYYDSDKPIRDAQAKGDAEVAAIYTQISAIEVKARTYGLLPEAINAIASAELNEQKIALASFGGSEKEIAVIDRKIEALQRLGSAQSAVTLLDLDKKIMKGSEDANAAMLAGAIGAETAKVAIYEASSNKIIGIERDLNEAKIAIQRAAIGGATAEQEAAYQKTAATISKVLADLKAKTTVDFKIAGLSDMSSELSVMAKTASTLGDGFKGAATALGGLSTALKTLADIQKKESETDRQDMSGRIGAYGDMASAASSFFEVGSNGYKTMQGVATAFHAVQLAMNVVEMAQLAVKAVLNQAGGDPYSAFFRMAAMAAAVGALGFAVGGGFDSGGGGQSAAQVQKTQFTGTDTSNQNNQNVGTVFGDSSIASKSLSTSLDLLRKNSDLTLPLTQGMLLALQSIATSIQGVVNIVYRVNGLASGTAPDIQQGVIGHNSISNVGNNLPVIGAVSEALQNLWGKVTQSITDSGFSAKGSFSQLEKGQGISQYANVETTSSSWFGLVKDTTENKIKKELGPELTDQFSKVFTNIGDAIKLAGKALGMDGLQMTTALESFVVDLPVSIKDLKGQALTDAMTAWLSTISDQAAATALPGLDKFRQSGEGYFQTVMRVATGVEQSSVALAQLGVHAIAYTDIINKQGDVYAERVRQSVVAQETVTTHAAVAGTGGIDPAVIPVLTGIGHLVQDFVGTGPEIVAFTKKLFDLRQEERNFGNAGADVTQAMITGAGSLEAYAAGQASYNDKFRTDSQKFVASFNGMSNSFSGLTDPVTHLSIALPSTRDGFSELVEKTKLLAVGTDDTAVAAQGLLGKLLTLSPGFDELHSKLESFESSVGASTDTIRSLIQDRLLGKINEADFGGQLGDILAGGVYNALASGVSDNITKMLQQNLLDPLMANILSGSSTASSISEIVTNANIDGMIAAANRAAEVLSQIYDNPEFKAAIAKVKAAGKEIASSIGSNTPVYKPYVPEPVSTPTNTPAAIAHTYADALKAMVEDTKKFADTLAHLGDTSYEAALRAINDAGIAKLKALDDAAKADGGQSLIDAQNAARARALVEFNKSTGSGFVDTNNAEQMGRYNAAMAVYNAAMETAGHLTIDNTKAVNEWTQAQIALLNAQNKIKSTAITDDLSKQIGQLGMTPAQKAYADIDDKAKAYLKSLKDLGQVTVENILAVDHWTDAMKAAEFEKELNSIKEAAGISSSGIAKLLVDGFLGNISKEDLGGALSNMIVGGVYNAMANQAAQAVTDILNRYLIDPIMKAILQGSSVTAALNATLNKANIDLMIGEATKVIAALTEVFNDPAFKAAMAQFQKAIENIAGTATTGTSGARYTPYVPANKNSATGSGGGAEGTASNAYQDALKAMLDEIAGFWKQLANLGQTSYEAAIQSIQDAGAKKLADLNAMDTSSQSNALRDAAITKAFSDLHSGMNSENYTEKLAAYQSAMASAVAVTVDNTKAVKDWTDAQIALLNAQNKIKSTAITDDLRKQIGQLGMSDLEKQIAGVNDKAADYLKSLQDLGQTTAANTADVEKWRAAMLGVIALAAAAKTADLNVQIQTLLGNAGAALAATRAKELLALSASDRAIQQHIYDLQDQATAAKKATDAMAEILKTMDAIAALKQSVTDAAEGLRMAAPGFDAVGDSAAKMAVANSALNKAWAAGAPASEQIALASKLKDAIMENYTAESDALKKGQDARMKALTDAQAKDLTNIQALSTAFQGMADYAKSLLLGAQTVLSPTQQLSEAKSQYETLLAAAKAGDATAAGKLQGASSTYLQDAQKIFASSADYASVFAKVLADMQSFGAQAPGAATTAAAAAQKSQDEIAALQKVFDSETLALQNKTIEQLNRLGNITDILQAHQVAAMNEQAIAISHLNLTETQMATLLTGLDTRISGPIVAAVAALDHITTIVDPRHRPDPILPPSYNPNVPSTNAQTTVQTTDNKESLGESKKQTAVLFDVKKLLSDLIDSVDASIDGGNVNAREIKQGIVIMGAKIQGAVEKL